VNEVNRDGAEDNRQTDRIRETFQGPPIWSITTLLVYFFNDWRSSRLETARLTARGSSTERQHPDA
jgi:hypothetical protein